MATLPTSMFPLMSDFTGENAVEFMVSKMCVYIWKRNSQYERPQLMVEGGGGGGERGDVRVRSGVLK